MKQQKSKVEEKFSEFFDEWLAQLEHLLRQMLVGPTPAPATDDHWQGLVSKVTAHVKAYYTAKWAAAREDVLPFYSPTWLTPLEASFLWVTGWKPSTVFRLVDSLRGKPTAAAMRTMSPYKARRIDELRIKIRAEEEKVDRDMERQQVAVADRRMVELSSRASSAGAEGVVNAAVGGMVAGLERVMTAADCVRLKALKGVLDELTIPQSVEFLAAVSMLQLQLRQWGRRRLAMGNATSTCGTDTNNNNNNSCNSIISSSTSTTTSLS